MVYLFLLFFVSGFFYDSNAEELLWQTEVTENTTTIHTTTVHTITEGYFLEDALRDVSSLLDEPDLIEYEQNRGRAHRTFFLPRDIFSLFVCLQSKLFVLGDPKTHICFD